MLKKRMSSKQKNAQSGTTQRPLGIWKELAIWRKTAVFTALVAAFFALSATTHAATATAKDSCAALADISFEKAADRPARVISARRVIGEPMPDEVKQMLLKRSQSQGAPVDEISIYPDHCRVEGYVAPAVGFLMLLPTKQDWNSKILVAACDAFCGATEEDMPVPGLVRKYATITTDGGHRGKRPFDGVWAYNDMEAKKDFAYGAIHLVSQVGKSIAATYYGKPHTYTYLTGFSKGGTAGIKSALTYPDDFDGIHSRAPVVEYQTINTVRLPWIHKVNTGADGKPLLDGSHMGFIHKAVTTHCDRLDGLVDGTIDDPRICDFDTKTLICAEGQTDECLSPAQAEALLKIYSPPVDAKGKVAYPAGIDMGSELKWVPFNVPSKGDTFTFSSMGGSQYLKYMAFKDNPGPNYDWLNFDYGRDGHLLEDMKPILDATDPDFSAFAKSGNKMIVTHGWADPAVSASMSIRWYENVLKKMGGSKKVQNYMRLFLMPGVAHGSGGPGPDIYDALAALERWVEKGIAPDKMEIREEEGGKVTRTRPLYPYPLRVRYKGKGSIDEAKNFEPYLPETK